MCGCCQTIMYPGPSGCAENHKKGYCSYGVKQTGVKITPDGKRKVEDPPEWSQPAGIFSKGTHFDPIKFLSTIHQIYERVIVQHGTSEADIMEYEAFAKELHSRTKILLDGSILFKLYADLQVSGPFPNRLMVDHDGLKYLRIDCLR